MITTSSPGDDVEAGDVGHQHVHAHRADDRRAAAANQHRAAAGEPQIEAVGVAGRHDRDRRRPLGGEPRAVADAFARRACPSPRRRGCRASSPASAAASTRAAAARCRRAAGPGARGRTRRASRAAARRCSRRGRTDATAAAARASLARSRARSVSISRARSNRDALLVEQRRLRDRRRSRNACRPRRARGSGSRAAPAACAAGCRSGSRAGSCRCRSSGDSGRAVLYFAAAACTARAAPGVEIVGVRRQSNRPSRSLTLSAPKTRISARTPAARSAAPSSMSAHASRSAPASSSAQRHLAGAVAVRVRLDDRDHAGRRASRALARRDSSTMCAVVGLERGEIDARDVGGSRSTSATSSSRIASYRRRRGSRTA